jgi:formylglycine-generating enzyme required for sulfatase activity
MNTKVHVKILFLLFAASTALASCAPKTSTRDGMRLMYVPAGDFLMGSSDADVSNYLKLFPDSSKDWFTDEQPQHKVYLDAFWIDRTEVTNAQYAGCVNAGACKAPYFSKCYTRSSYYGNSSFADYPVVYVDWNMAKAYCQWAGRDLPTEAQWEKAARGTKGQMYPQGSEIDCNKANYFGKRDGCVGNTSAVGSYPAGASRYGALDMAGNVWEWVADWYDTAYDGKSPSNNPTGPASGTTRVLRGGSWQNNDQNVRAANRESSDPAKYYYKVGFRCSVSQP